MPVFATLRGLCSKDDYPRTPAPETAKARGDLGAQHAMTQHAMTRGAIANGTMHPMLAACQIVDRLSR